MSARDLYAALYGKHVALVIRITTIGQISSKKVHRISEWRLLTFRDSALVDWSANAACEKLREKVHHAKRKLEKQTPPGPAEAAGPSEPVLVTMGSGSEMPQSPAACWTRQVLQGWLVPGLFQKRFRTRGKRGQPELNADGSRRENKDANATHNRAW